MLFQPASNIQVPFMQPQFRRGRAVVSGGGSPMWYDDLDPATANNYEIVVTDYGYLPGVTLPAGTVSKLRFNTVGSAFSASIKMALFDSGRNLVTYGSQAFSGQIAGWCEVPVTPAIISAGAYFIGFRTDTNFGSANIPIFDGSGSMDLITGSYADFPPGSYSPAAILNRDYAMGAYIS